MTEAHSEVPQPVVGQDPHRTFDAPEPEEEAVPGHPAQAVVGAAGETRKQTPIRTPAETSSSKEAVDGPGEDRGGPQEINDSPDDTAVQKVLGEPAATLEARRSEQS